jgi:excisionase family DNA binding protein
LLLLKEAARYLRINKQTILRLLLKGEINYLVSGNEVFLDTEELDRWLEKAEKLTMLKIIYRTGG